MARGQCYKTFSDVSYDFSRVFVPGKPFQPSPMFSGMGGAYLSEAPFRCSTLGQAPGLTHKH